MNGIEKITARLIRDAQAEVDAINAEADAQCAAILAEAEARETIWKIMPTARSELSTCTI